MVNCWFYFARTLKPPLAYDGAPVLVIKKDKPYAAVGYASSHTLLVLHDGKSDQFNLAPPIVKKQFKNVSAIRDFVGAEVSSKVFALVLEDYKSKGQYRFELSSVRMRLGYGRANLKCVSSQGTSASDVMRFFGIPQSSQATVGLEPTEAYEECEEPPEPSQSIESSHPNGSGSAGENDGPDHAEPPELNTALEAPEASGVGETNVFW